MSTQNTTIIEDEDIDEELYELDVIEGLDELEEEELEEATGHKLDTRIKENDGEDNYFDEAYFEE